MTALKWLVLVPAGYAALVAALYFGQRALMYFPDTVRTAPAAVGLPQADEVPLTSNDGETIVAWHVPPSTGKPVILYFHGNGGALRLRADRFRRLTADGTGLLAVSYRGYGGSTGRPSEEGLLRDAAAAYDFAVSRYGAQALVLWGESLGSGVAVALAANRPIARLLLESPFTSTADVAAAVYWFAPVRLLMHDQFRSDLRIPKVSAPVLILHGTQDRVVDIKFGERLYALVTAPKQFIRLPGAGHNDHDAHGGLEAVRPFVTGAGPQQKAPPR